MNLTKSHLNNASVCLDHILSCSHSFGFAHTNLRVYLSPHHLFSPPSREETGRRAITLTTHLIGYMWVIANCCTPLTTSRALYTQNVHNRGSVGERSIHLRPRQKAQMPHPSISAKNCPPPVRRPPSRALIIKLWARDLPPQKPPYN